MGAEDNGTADTPTGDRLRQLSDEASRLAATVRGALRSIRLRDGESSVELEWELTGGWSRENVEPNPAAQANGNPLGAPALRPEPDEREIVRSPMVGTFYCAPAPGEPPFIGVGSTVEPNTVIGIVEAMKLMNQITADRHGVIREVLVSDNQPVEFEQPLVVLAAQPPDQDG